MDMNIFEVNRMLKEREQELDEAQKRWEETGSKEDRLAVGLTFLEMQILQSWISEYKEEIKSDN